MVEGLFVFFVVVLLLLLYSNIELLSLMYTSDKVNEMGMQSVETFVIQPPNLRQKEIFVSAF